jgi:hypothetical protein
MALETKPVAWMHPTAGWARTKYHSVLIHCQKDGPGPVPLFYAPSQAEAVITDEMRAEALRLLKARDERDDKVQEIIEDLREIVLLMPAASRPDGLFKHAQDAVYAMRGRTRLMDDAALTAALLPTHKPLQEEG